MKEEPVVPVDPNSPLGSSLPARMESAAPSALTAHLSERAMETFTSAAGIAPGLVADHGRQHALDNGLSPGSQVGSYVVEKSLGAGGGGTVYLARRGDQSELVALKVLRPGVAGLPGMVERFVREAQTSKQLRHPNIVDIFDFGEFTGGLYYAMEYMPGQNLHELLDSQGRLSPAEIVRVLNPVLDAIHTAHLAGVVHRDIKASNIMLCEVGGQSVIKLLDFGIAKLMSWEGQAQGLTAPGQALGTAQYMAPEQIRGLAVDTRADIYSLGALIFQLATGEVPFNHPERTRIFAAHLLHPPPRPSELAPLASCLDAIVLRCMEKSPGDRFQTVAQLKEQLNAAVSEAPAPISATELEVVLDIQTEEGAIEDADADVCAILDMVEDALTDLGLVVASSTSNGLCAVQSLGSDEDLAAAQATLEAQLEALRNAVEKRPDRYPGVTVELLQTERRPER